LILRTPTLAWTASSDNAGVTRYNVLRDGVALGTAPGTTYVDTSAQPNTTYTYTVTANAQLLASTAVVSVVATTFAGAERAAHDLVAPMLSWWSYRYDVPIELKGWAVRERATNITRLRFGVLARSAQTDNNSYVAKPEYRYVLSAYREGMNATNPMYQACCFYRVIEGAHRLRGARRIAVGASFREPTNEAIPSGEPLAQLNFHERAAIRPYAGRSFGFVRDQLRDLVRNAASHLDPTGAQETLIADELADLTRCEDATLVLKYMARVILDNEFRADPDVAPLL